MVGTLVKGYMCATSWCDLDLTFDLVYLMLFYVSTRISDTIYLSYIFLLESWLLHPWVSFGVTDGIASCEPQVLPQFHIKACFYCVKYPYLILTSAYVLAGAYMDDQTRILFLKRISLSVPVCMRMTAHAPTLE